MCGIREESVESLPKWDKTHTRSRSLRNLIQIPKVRLEPTRVLPHRILSPVRLLLALHWARIARALHRKSLGDFISTNALVTCCFRIGNIFSRISAGRVFLAERRRFGNMIRGLRRVKRCCAESMWAAS
jgi:hypothetical protein